VQFSAQFSASAHFSAQLAHDPSAAPALHALARFLSLNGTDPSPSCPSLCALLLCALPLSVLSTCCGGVVNTACAVRVLTTISL